MVIAGPGTGKTELLSVRVANILQKTDTLAESILCLTFTESGAQAMRNRLTEIIGKDAYKISVHTFHSFGSEIINQNSEFFYKSSNFRPADELSSYEIIKAIFDELPHLNPLAQKQNGEYIYLKDSQKSISELKKSGLTSGELLSILEENDLAIERIEQTLEPILAERINKQTATKLSQIISDIRKIDDKPKVSAVLPLSQVIADSLLMAISNAEAENSTKPITAWKNAWSKKDETGKSILKSRERQVKLRAMSYIYDQYLCRMHEASLFDFDDMILQVVHAVETNDELRFNLQEKYLYIMVDEFQDTNMAQMRILKSLTTSEVQGDTPNIMAVGDDDQAIYSFQGADVSNILDFKRNYPKAKIVTLTQNYRSHSDILSGSRHIITQGQNRLENILENIDKQLIANSTADGHALIFEANSINDERVWLVDSIKKQLSSNTQPNSITVLTRRHHEIEKLLPYFASSNIAVNYERRDNVLEFDVIKQIVDLSRLIINLADGKHDNVNGELPKLLAHEMWQINPQTIWKLSLDAYKNRLHWLEVMEQDAELVKIQKWLVIVAQKSIHTPLEQILDIIVGVSSLSFDDNEFCSPIYGYYFSEKSMKSAPDKYLAYLEALRKIRSQLREYRPDQEHTLKNFISYVDLCNTTKTVISSTRNASQNQNAVNIMTAHKSKGLEFDTVYIFNAVDSNWGEKAKKHSRLISYPENLQITPAGESEDERLRLFYVAATRAKKHLYISYSLQDDNSSSTYRAAFIFDNKWKINQIASTNDVNKLITAEEIAWYNRLIPTDNSNLSDLLKPTLENYKLSVTHLHNFLDISKGGPTSFLLQNLLRFPKSKSPNAAFGTAIHETLKHAHDHYLATDKQPATEDVMSYFEKVLKGENLEINDFNLYLQKGNDILQKFIEQKTDLFSKNQRPELDFSKQGALVGNAHLTGKLDLVNIDKPSQTMTVIDYKTGKPMPNWTGKTDYDKIRLHKYHQQLMFYGLMIKKSKDYHNYHVETSQVQFVEPNKNGDLLSLTGNYSSDDLKRFEQLIIAIWDHIINLNLPDTSAYGQKLDGIIAFENDLIGGII